MLVPDLIWDTLLEQRCPIPEILSLESFRRRWDRQEITQFLYQLMTLGRSSGQVWIRRSLVTIKRNIYSDNYRVDVILDNRLFQELQHAFANLAYDQYPGYYYVRGPEPIFFLTKEELSKIIDDFQDEIEVEADVLFEYLGLQESSISWVYSIYKPGNWVCTEKRLLRINVSS